MTQDESAPKIHIDSDWKAEAQAEKERLAAQEESRAAQQPASGSPGGMRELPEASFKSLIGLLASQALMGLGTMQDPETKGVVVDLEGSRFSIDLLDVLEEKTKGNLTEEEGRELTQITAELRSRFVQITKLIAEQAVASGPNAGAGGPPIVS